MSETVPSRTWYTGCGVRVGGALVSASVPLLLLVQNHDRGTEAGHRCVLEVVSGLRCGSRHDVTYRTLKLSRTPESDLRPVSDTVTAKSQPMIRTRDDVCPRPQRRLDL